MIRPSLFRWHLLVTLAVTLLFVVLGNMAFRMSTHMDHERAQATPPLFLAELIDQLSPNDRARAAEVLSRANHGFLRYRLELVDSGGRVLYPQGAPPVPLKWQPEELPAHAHEVRVFPEGHGPGEPRSIVRLAGEPAEYLVLTSDPGHDARRRNNFYISLGYMMTSVVLATLLSLFLLFYRTREQARLADSVISELQKGNLKARFPIKKMDEVGQAMLRFNRMADEIERLVERLKSAEQSRISLLQELAHDLRTPVASLKNLLETQASRGAQLTEQLKGELLELSLKEVEYFERLVEDLLFLARVSEPRYRSSPESFRVIDLLDDEIETTATRYRSGRGGPALRKEFPADMPSIPGDPHLLRRLFRNAFDNAFSFARAEVAVQASLDSNGSLEIVVRDDGIGLSPEALDAFGKRRISRVLEGTHEGRLSVGLGSVIMKTIAQLHRGEVAIRNRISERGEILGAELRITLPVGYHQG